MLRDKDMGMLIEPARMSLDEYLKHWLKTSVKPRVRARTYGEYASTLERYVTKRIGAMPLSSIKPSDLQKVYSEMQEEGLAGMARLTPHAAQGRTRSGGEVADAYP